jgi:hypothetical protein
LYNYPDLEVLIEMKKKSVKSKRPKMKAKCKRKRKMALNITKTLLKNELINKSGEL